MKIAHKICVINIRERFLMSDIIIYGLVRSYLQPYKSRINFYKMSKYGCNNITKYTI